MCQQILTYIDTLRSERSTCLRALWWKNSEINGSACVVNVSDITPAADSNVAHAAVDGNYKLERVGKHITRNMQA